MASTGFGIGGSVTITHRGRLLLALALTLGAAGIIQPDTRLASALLSTSLALLAYMLVAAYLVSAKSSVIAGLRVERFVPEPLTESRETVIRLRVINDSFMALDNAVIADEPPILFLAEKPPRTTTLIPAKGSVEVTYVVKPVIGRHEWGAVRIESLDPLGLLKTAQRIGPATIVSVQPSLPPLPRRRVAATLVYQPGGVAGTRRRGVGVEFLELREYQPGDDMRLIEWKAYARTRRLAVKVFEQEGIVRLILVLDESPTMFRGPLGATPLEQGARIVAGLAAYSSTRGDVIRAAIIPATGRRIHYTGWLRGRRVLIHVNRLVAERTTWPSTTYPRAPSEALGLYRGLLRLALRGQSVIILVTDVGLSGEMAKRFSEEFYKAARYYGTPVLVVVPRPRHVKSPYEGLEVLDIIRRQALVVETLRSKGVPVLYSSPGAVLRELVRLVEYARLVGTWPRLS